MTRDQEFEEMSSSQKWEIQQYVATLNLSPKQMEQMQQTWKVMLKEAMSEVLEHTNAKNNAMDVRVAKLEQTLKMCVWGLPVLSTSLMWVLSKITT